MTGHQSHNQSRNQSHNQSHNQSQLSSPQSPHSTRSPKPGRGLRRTGKSSRSPLKLLLIRLLGGNSNSANPNSANPNKNPKQSANQTRSSTTMPHREALAQRSASHPHPGTSSAPIKPISPPPNPAKALGSPKDTRSPKAAIAQDAATVAPFRLRSTEPSRRLQEGQNEAQRDVQKDVQKGAQARAVPSNVVPLSERRGAARSSSQRSGAAIDRQPRQDPHSQDFNPQTLDSKNKNLETEWQSSSSSSLGAAESRRSRQSAQPKPPQRRVSPWVYGMRLLIIGIGVGAIAGTALSLLEPTLRIQPPTRNPRIVSAAFGGESTLRNSQTVTLTANQEMTDLSAKLAAIARGNADLTPGVFVADLTRGEYATLNGDNVFSSASMIKVPILIAFFQEVDAGTIRLDEVLTIQQDDLAEGSGEMQHLPVGTQYSALETATQMIIASDNTATNMIMRRLGGIEKLNQRFKQWGLQQTLIRDRLPDLNGTNTASPKELVALLGTVTQGGLLSMTSRDRVITIMRSTVNNALLPQSIGEGALIAHKTGDIGAMLGDTGIVDLPNGKRYLIAVMVKRPVNDERAFELIQKLGGEVYQHFAPITAASTTQSQPASQPAQSQPAQSQSTQPQSEPIPEHTPTSER